MQPEFWLQRWAQNKTGFHLDEVNPYLSEHWPRLDVSVGDRIFVPMCGKSVDMRWLMEQGYTVEAIELSELAIEAFFREQEIEYQRRQLGEWFLFEADKIRIWCGDYFEFNAQQLNYPRADSTLVAQITAIFDRAALIAMPQNSRPRYLAQLMNLVGPVPQMLVCLDYSQPQMMGPPFAVSQAEVVNFYQDYFEIDKIITISNDVLAKHPHFADRGLTSLSETVYLMQVPKK